MERGEKSREISGVSLSAHMLLCRVLPISLDSRYDLDQHASKILPSVRGKQFDPWRSDGHAMHGRSEVRSNCETQLADKMNK